MVYSYKKILYIQKLFLLIKTWRFFSGEILKPTHGESKPEPEAKKANFFDTLFGFITKEIQPSVEQFISKGKQLVQDLELEKKGKELVERAKEYVLVTISTFIVKLITKSVKKVETINVY